MSPSNSKKQGNLTTIAHAAWIPSAKSEHVGLEGCAQPNTCQFSPIHTQKNTCAISALHLQLRRLSRYLAPAFCAVGLCVSTPLWAKQAFQQSSLPEAVVANCPSVSFFEFISVFADDPAIQRQHTQLHAPMAIRGASAFALQKMDYSANSTSAAIPMPVIPLESQRKAKGVSLRIDDVTDNQAVVVMTSIHTNARVIYQFQKSACWNLVGIQNDSL